MNTTNRYKALKICKVCGKEFKINAPSQTMCSTECRQKSDKEYKKNYDYGQKLINGEITHRMTDEIISDRNKKRNEKFLLRFSDLNIPDDIGNYFAGFTDGEGTFTIHPPYKKDRLDGWKTRFSIQLRLDDKDILCNLRDILKVGIIVERISRKNSSINPQCCFTVSNISQLYHIIVPFFEKFTLRAKKKRDFDIWANAVRDKYELDYKEGNSSLEIAYNALKEERKYRES